MMTEHTTINWTDIHSRLRAGEAALEAILHPTESVIRGELDRRAEQLARSRQASTDSAARQSLSLLVFGIEGRKFAVELARVEQIGSLPPCTPVPGASPDLCGIMQHQGEIRSVVDMAHRLGLAPKASASGGYFLHIRAAACDNGPQAGSLFRVQELHQVLNINPDELVTDNKHEHKILGDVVRAICPQGVIVLDCAKLCAGSSADRRPADASAAHTAFDTPDDKQPADSQENLT